MKLTGTLIGATLGALVGGLAWFYMETSGPRDASWAAVLLGLLTGIGARLLSAPAESVIPRGALTAVIALAAMVGTGYAIKQKVERDAQANTQPATILPTVDEQDESSEPSDEETPLDLGEEAEQPDERIVVPATSAQSTRSTNFTNQNVQPTAIWLAVYYVAGALLAYLFGKGPMAASASINRAAVPEDENPE